MGLRAKFSIYDHDPKIPEIFLGAIFPIYDKLIKIPENVDKSINILTELDLNGSKLSTNWPELSRILGINMVDNMGQNVYLRGIDKNP